MYRKNSFITLLAEFQQEYLDDLHDILISIKETLEHLKKNVSNNEILEDLCRQIHSIKGTAGSYDLGFISKVCHNWEDLLADFDGTAKENTFLYQQSLKIITLLDDYRLSPNDTNRNFECDLNSILLDDKEEMKRVLILENSSMMINLYIDILKSYDYSISCANDGYIAMGRLLTEKFDLIITSYDVSTIDGLSLINSLRVMKNPNLDSQAILVTSKVLNNTYFNDNDKNAIITKENILNGIIHYL